MGVYGVVALAVTNRTREIGVRVAMGATRGLVIRGVFGDALRLAGPGLLVGGLLAVATAAALRSLLLGLSPVDPASFLSAGALLLFVVVTASHTNIPEVEFAPALTVTKTGPPSAAVGSGIGYQIRVSNDTGGGDGSAISVTLVTDTLDLSPFTSCTLSFWGRDTFATDYQYHGIWVSTTSQTDTTTFSEITSISATAEGTWTKSTVDLSAYAESTTVYVAFRYEETNGTNWWVDNVYIKGMYSYRVVARRL